jgi:hypothetical protein
VAKNRIRVPLYQPVDIVVKGACALDNPFFADLKGIFHGPGGSYTIPGFYDGGNTWKIRFSPTAVGTWSYTIVSPHIQIETTGGELQCTRKTNPNIHGGLRVDPEHPHHFAYEDGTPCFMFAYEADWLWALGLGDPQIGKVHELINQVKGYGFNQIIMQLYAHDAEWCKHKDGSKDNDYGPPAMYAWQGTNDHPDHDHMNPAYFENFDRVMQLLLDEGFTAHVFLKVYNKFVSWPAKYSLGDDLYFKYVTARYQAFPNIIWDYSKESYYELDKDYLASRLAIVKANDGYRRLLTVHDDRRFYGQPQNAGLLDFATLQQHDEFYNSMLLNRAARQWPIFNSEFGYESGPGGVDDYFAWSNNTVEDFINRAWQVAMGGAYIGYYYNYTAWNIIDYSHIPPGYKLFKILADFFTSIDWWAFEPRPDYVRNDRILCLARGTAEYVMYTRPGGSADLPDDLLGEHPTGVWMNTFTGETIPAQGKRTSASHFSQERWVFESPFKDVPGVLHIRSNV